MEGTFGEYKKAFEQEVTQFFILCSKDDVRLLVKRYNEKNLQEYVRLASIAMLYGYRRIVLKIAQTVEKDFDKFLSGFDILNGNFALLEKWVTDFIDRIDDNDIKNLTLEYWQERKAKFDIENFTVEQIK